MKFSYDLISPIKSISLWKVNPYLKRENQNLPYHYLNPSFTKRFRGPVLQKDFDIKNLFRDHLGQGKGSHKRKVWSMPKFKKFKWNKSPSPKEIIISPNKISFNTPKNIFDNCIWDQEIVTKRRNPFITKYGEFNFGFHNNTPNMTYRQGKFLVNRRNDERHKLKWEHDKTTTQKMNNEIDWIKDEDNELPYIEGNEKMRISGKRNLWNNEFIKSKI